MRASLWAVAVMAQDGGRKRPEGQSEAVAPIIGPKLLQSESISATRL